MALYRCRKTFDAFQWTGGPDQTEDPVWICDAIRDGKVWIDGSGESLRMHIRNGIGTEVAEAGDWVYRRQDTGGIFAAKPATWAKYYEPVT